MGDFLFKVIHYMLALRLFYNETIKVFGPMNFVFLFFQLKMNAILKGLVFVAKLVVVFLMCYLFYLTWQFKNEPNYRIIVFSVLVIILGTIFDFFFRHWAMDRFPRLRWFFWTFIIFYTLVFLGFVVFSVRSIYLTN